jgi:glycosyltransferase involved in cell wall biosynthesis
MADSSRDDRAVSVSVVIPAYNAEQYIRAAIQSAQAQTLPDIEIVVIDDASTDRTPSVVQELARRDARVRYSRMATNSGPAASRNQGLTLARGEWIALLDADDRFRSDRLESLLTLARREEADIVSDNPLMGTESDGTGQPMISKERLSEPRLMSFVEFVEGCFHDPKRPGRVSYVFMHPMFRRAFLERNTLQYNALSRNGEDFLLYLDCLAAKARWFITPDPMYYYTVRDGSLTEIVSGADRQFMTDKVRSLTRDPRIVSDPELTRALVRHWRQIAPTTYYGSFKNGLRAGDHRAVLRALAQDRAAIGFILSQVVRRLPRLFRPALRRVTATRRS